MYGNWKITINSGKVLFVSGSDQEKQARKIVGAKIEEVEIVLKKLEENISKWKADCTFSKRWGSELSSKAETPKREQLVKNELADALSRRSGSSFHHRLSRTRFQAGNWSYSRSKLRLIRCVILCCWFNCAQWQPRDSRCYVYSISFEFWKNWELPSEKTSWLCYTVADDGLVSWQPRRNKENNENKE